MLRDKKLLAIFALGAGLNLGLLLLYYMPSPKALVGDEGYYFHLASQLARGRAAQHDPLFPPLYAELLAGLFRLFGRHRLVAQLLQIGLWLASAVLLYRICERLSPAPAARYVAVGLFLCSPELGAFAHYFWPETLHMFFWLAALALLVCGGRRPAAQLASGALLGLALLTKSLLLPFIPVLLLWLVLEPGRALRARLGGAALLGLALLLTVGPALLGQRGSGQPALGQSATINLWIGLTDVERVDYRRDRAGAEIAAYVAAAPDVRARNALYRGRIAALPERQGLAGTLRAQLGRQYFRLFDHATFFTTQLPGGPRRGYQLQQPLLTTTLRWWSRLSYGLILLGGALGVALVRLRPWGWPQLLLFFLAYNLGLFGLLHVKTRYTLQFLPVLIVLAAVALVGLRALLLRQAAELPGFAFTPGRWLVGALLALLMAFLMLHSVFA